MNAPGAASDTLIPGPGVRSFFAWQKPFTVAALAARLGSALARK
jgi:hypothetical protein